jgi:oligoribonuclease (3'-5' exoribonuclease)
VPNNNLILILDLETTGNEDLDEIVEFGGVMLDSPSLNEIGSFSIVIQPSTAAFKRLMEKDVVRKMHETNGLLADLQAGKGVSVDVADDQIVHWIKQFTEDSSHVPYGGSGVSHFDRPYIKRFLPKLNKRITYWALDVGSSRRIAMLRGSQTASIEAKDHRALQDSRVHADELRFYAQRFEYADRYEDLLDLPEDETVYGSV